MAQAPTQIIMLSTLTEKGVVTTFQALELGQSITSRNRLRRSTSILRRLPDNGGENSLLGQQGIEERPVAELPPPAFPADADILVIARQRRSAALGNLLRVIMPLSFPVLVVQEMPADFTVPFVDFSDV